MADQIVDDLLDFFSDELLVQERLSVDNFGRPTYSPTVLSIPAKITGKVQLIRSEAGQERVSTVQATTAGAFGLTTSHLYTLPARFDPLQPPALAVAKITDENGPHHERVYF